MYAALTLVSLLAVTCSAAVEPDAGADSRRQPMLAYRLEAQQAYAVDEPVVIGFTLENRSEETLWVLTWYTPLEGILGEIFRVTRDGEALRYGGPMVKRGDPDGDQYVRLEGGQSVSARVDLALAYALTAGPYRVEFQGTIHDVVRDAEAVPRPRDAHRSRVVPGSAVDFRLVEP